MSRINVELKESCKDDVCALLQKAFLSPTMKILGRGMKLPG